MRSAQVWQLMILLACNAPRNLVVPMGLCSVLLKSIRKIFGTQWLLPDSFCKVLYNLLGNCAGGGNQGGGNQGGGNQGGGNQGGGSRGSGNQGGGRLGRKLLQGSDVSRCGGCTNILFKLYMALPVIMHNRDTIFNWLVTKLPLSAPTCMCANY